MEEVKQQVGTPELLPKEKKSKLPLVLAVGLLLLAGAYAALCVWVSMNGTILPNVQVGDTPVGGMTVDQAAQTIKTEADAKFSPHQAEVAFDKTEVLFVSGDHITAAETIARGLGILKEGERAITGEELQKMDDDTLRAEIKNISVYSRLTAEDKLRIVSVYKEVGETVAVTGDSVEDAAILKEADVGCAMGVTGTDIAKGAADVVLTEDSYISVIGAIKESRGIYANIKRVASQVLSCALGELLLMLLEIIIFGYPALTVLPIMWLNLVVGFAVILGLSYEKAGADVMQNPPRQRREHFFKGEYGISIIWQGVLICLLGIIAYAIGGSAMLFAVLVLSEVSLAFGLRSELSVFKVGLHTNKGMLIALGVAIATLLLISGPLHTVFSLEKLTGTMVLEIVLLSIVPLVVTEIVKFAKNYSKKRG